MEVIYGLTIYYDYLSFPNAYIPIITDLQFSISLSLFPPRPSQEEMQAGTFPGSVHY